MVFFQPIIFFIVVRLLVYYLNSSKDILVNQNIEPKVIRSPIENSNAAYEEEFESPVVIDQKVDLAVKSLRPKIKYIANGKELLCDLNRYYYLKLGLPLPIMRIDRDVITRAYEIKLAAEVEDNSDLDIVAAGNFFEDRIMYLSLN